MKKPIIIAVDDDPQVLRSIKRDLRNEYKKDYRVLSTESANEALEVLEDLKKKNESVALLVSDQRMPEMGGVDYLEKARAIYPEAKRILLTAYSDTDAAIKAINDVQLDYYLMKPWDPPKERLYPVLDDLLDEWQANWIPEYEGIRMVGYQWSPRSHEIKDYLTGNLIPYQWLDIESNAKAKELMELHKIEAKDLPAVFFEDNTHLVNPDLKSIAEKIGKKAQASEKMYDVVIIGAGPSGLAAAVYGASEGLRTLLIERRAPGGQAGTSSRIENYLGFPSGLSGSELARRAITQATRFGTEFLSPQEVTGIRFQDNYKIVQLADGTEVNTQAIIITTGVDYRRLDKPGLHEFTGAGVYYGAATTEANACKNQDVYIVGGGNSAGQGAMYLSNFAKKVHILVRAKDISRSMSQYLVDQIAQTPNIEVVGETEVIEAHGDGNLDHLSLIHNPTGEVRKVKAGSLFIFIGARPYTDWVEGKLIRNPKGFIETGRDLYQYDSFKTAWKLEREPFLLETCVPGIFAAGDVRAGAMNRVASAVGEGAMAIKFTHSYLAEV